MEEIRWTTSDVLNLVSTGINYQPQMVQDLFHQQYQYHNVDNHVAVSVVFSFEVLKPRHFPIAPWVRPPQAPRYPDPIRGKFRSIFCVHVLISNDFYRNWWKNLWNFKFQSSAFDGNLLGPRLFQDLNAQFCACALRFMVNQQVRHFLPLNPCSLKWARCWRCWWDQKSIKTPGVEEVFARSSSMAVFSKGCRNFVSK